MPNLIPLNYLERRIYIVRGHKVMLDEDLAFLYGVPTHRLNQQVKRNFKRFPSDFMFQLTRRETEILISQFAISSSNMKSQFATSSWGCQLSVQLAELEKRAGGHDHQIRSIFEAIYELTQPAKIGFKP